MVDINVHGDIANKSDGVFLSAMGMDNAVFSLDTVQNIFNDNQKEKDFRFNIHCNGGSVAEGLAIYDYIRTSGKNIYTNIEGGCHSMAVCILLAAPLENRTANRNSRALIHPVYVAPSDFLNKEQLRELTHEVEIEESTILDIYVDRTGCDRKKLVQLMKEEKQRTAQELLELGFISKINNYTTNSIINKKSNKMSNKKKSILNRLTNLLGGIVNYDFFDADENVLFTTESEDNTLEIGMVASPDGTHTLPDGTVVTIAEGVITEIVPGETAEVTVEEFTNLKKENEELMNLVSEALNQMKEDEKTINTLRNQVKSGYQVKGRLRTPNSPAEQQSIEDMKNELRENLKKTKRGGVV